MDHWCYSLELHQRIEQAAHSEAATVLLLGESGTGKELVAKSIHNNSPRKDGPFKAVHCGALAGSLLESELFGHEKFAFTDAKEAKAGKFELAENGTVFLDEIGDADPKVQVELLRVLQEREFERVGGQKVIKVNVRVVAATNQDLQDKVRKGEFRQDLFYRLRVVVINVPPLRDRGDDIQLLATHFLSVYAMRERKGVTGLSARAVELLRSHAWPGNVRELENVIEAAVVLAKPDRDGGLIEIDLDPVRSHVSTHLAMLAGGSCTSTIADRVFDDLMNGRQPLAGFRRGDKESGTIASVVIEGMALGFQQFLATDVGQTKLKNLTDVSLLELVGLTGHRSKKSILQQHIVKRLKENLQRTRNSQFRA